MDITANYSSTSKLFITMLTLLLGVSLCYSQALNDIDFTAYDYIARTGNVSENDNLPEGNRTHRFLNEPFHGNIEWTDSTLGTFSYLVNPLNVQIYAGGGIWAYPAPYTIRLDSIFYEVCVETLCDTALLEIFIAFHPDSPVALNDTFFIETGSTRMFDVSINDYDPDSLSDPNRFPNRFFERSLPNHLDQNLVLNSPYLSEDGSFTYRPESGYVGTDSFTYIMYDPLGCDDSSFIATATIFILPPNNPPFASQINLGNIDEESIRNQNLSFFTFDPEGETLTYRIIQQGVGGLATTSSAGAMTYTAALNFIGPDTLYYEVTDLVGQTDTAAIILTVVNANNDAPIAPERTFSTIEDNTLDVNLAFTDYVDGDVLSYSIDSQPAHGTATLAANGQLFYSPNLNYVGTDILQYRSCDAGNLCSTSSITIQINPVNDSPIAADDTNELPINGSLTAGLISNISDIDSPLNTLTFSLLNAPTHGNIALTANGIYSYTPEEYYYGEDNFSYSVCDNEGACATGEVIITVTLVNLPPEASNSSWTMDEDMEATLLVEESVFDFGNSDLVYSIIESSAIGSFSNITNVGLHFQPLENINGNFIITYEVCDTGNLCDTAEIDLNILPINDTPTAFNSSFNGTEDEALNWQAQYTDIESEVLQLSILQAPIHGSIESNTYIPDIDFFGSDSLTFAVCDESGSCATGVVFITIAPINDSPIALEDVVIGSEDYPLSASIATNDSDIDSSNLVYAAVAENNPANISIDADGSLYWLPPANFSGYTTVSYSVCDSNGACDTADVQIQIEEINDAPLVNFPSLLIPEDGEAEYTANYYAFDIEGQTIFQSLASAQGVNVTLDPATGFLVITPVSNYFGNAFIAINTCDALGACSADTVFINVAPVNDTPYGFEFAFNTFQNISTTGSWYNHVFDLDDTLLTFNAIVAFGSVSIENDGTFSYNPAPDFLGVDTLWLEACDSSAACVSLQFLMDVLPPNQPPVVENTQRSLCQGTSVEIVLEEMAYDEVDSAANLQYSFFSSVNSTYTIDPNAQTLIISPSAFYAGEMIVDFQVCDNASPALCSNGTITLQITATTSPEIVAFTVNNISCFGQNNGSIIIEQVSDDEGVLFVWDNASADSAIYNLSAGSYNVELTGLSSCSTPSVAQFIVTEPEALTLQLASQSISSPNSGLITSTVTGGTPPFDYQWTGPDNYNASSPAIDNLNNAGQYFLTVTDANGCSVDSVVMITPTELIAFETFNVFPNPSNGQYLTIELPSVAHAGNTIKITDTKGTSVLETTVHSKSETLKIDSLSPGMYFVIASEGVNTYYARIMITY